MHFVHSISESRVAVKKSESAFSFHAYRNDSPKPTAIFFQFKTRFSHSNFSFDEFPN